MYIDPRKPNINVQKLQSSRKAGGRSDRPSESCCTVPSFKPSPGSHIERESPEASKTPGTAIWRKSLSGWVTPWDFLRDWPWVEMPGVCLSVA